MPRSMASNAERNQEERIECLGEVSGDGVVPPTSGMTAAETGSSQPHHGSGRRSCK